MVSVAAPNDTLVHMVLQIWIYKKDLTYHNTGFSYRLLLYSAFHYLVGDKVC